MKNTRLSLVRSIFVFLIIGLISWGLARLIPWITYQAELDTPLGAVQVEVALQETATGTPTPTATVPPPPTKISALAGAVQPQGTATPAANASSGQVTPPGDVAQMQDNDAPSPPATQSVEVVVTVKDETKEEEEEKAAVSPPGWETAISNGQATLTLVIINQGEVMITPCLVIPAIYDAQDVPLAIDQADIYQGALLATVTPTLNKEIALCNTGITGQPGMYFGGEKIIQPASALEYSLTLHFTSDAPLPYKGQVDIYIPEAPPPKEDEEKSKAEPYQSLEFTVREKPKEDFATAWKNLRDWGEPVLKTLLEVAVVILGAVLLVALYNQIRSYLKPSISLGKISTDQEDKKGIGEKITALLQDELDRFRGPRPYHKFSPTLATASVQTELFNFPTKLKEFGAVQIILDILEQLFKRNVINVTGQTQQSNAKGVGLTLTITDNRAGSIVDTQTFWELDYSGTGELVAESGDSSFAPYLLIVQPAATWITYKVSEHLGKPYTPLGTESWQSHAYCVCALHMFGLVGRKNAPSDAKHQALDLFYTALDRDPNNPVANINLARFEYEAAGQQVTAQARRFQYDLSQARLNNIAAAMEERVEQEEKLWNRLKTLFLWGRTVAEGLSDHELWLYQSLYNQAVVGSVEAVLLGSKELNLPEEARTKRRKATNHLDSLRCKLVKKARSLPKKRDKKNPGQAQGTIPPQKSVNDPAQESTPSQGQDTDSKLLEELNRCIEEFAELADLEDRLADERSAVQIKAFRQASLCILGMMVLDLGGEPWLESTDHSREDFVVVIAGAKSKISQINYRVHYNLACYYSLAADYKEIAADKDKKEWCFEKGIFHLGLGLEFPGDLNNFARVDGDLENLRKNKPDRFNAIVNRHAETPMPILGDPVSLKAVLDILSEQADVDTPQELLQAGRTRANRRNLATKSDGKLSYKVITRWVRMIDLMRLTGVDELYARLLYEAGVVSPQVLKGKNATTLHKTLEEFNKKNKLVKRMPSRDQLAKWIRKAKGLQDLVE